MAIFILTSPTDTQALQVAWGLRAAGHEWSSGMDWGGRKGAKHQSQLEPGARSFSTDGNHVKGYRSGCVSRDWSYFEHRGVSPEDAKACRKLVTAHLTRLSCCTSRIREHSA